jgi:hypothetical protein
VGRPTDLIVAATDARLAQLVDADPAGRYGLSGGDLHRSLGSPPARDDMQLLPMDALRVRFDEEEDAIAVAHVVARDGWWRGALLGVVNCAFIGDWNVAPRAHPNDGHFDVVEVSSTMTIRQRLEARRRLPHGNHLPHPAIAVRTAESGVWIFEQARDVYLDGVRRGRTTRLEITISPDHFSIHM